LEALDRIVIYITYIRITMKQIITRRAGLIGMICLLAVSLTSCLKHHDDFVEVPVALISAVNASPDAQPVDFFLDQNQANQLAIPSGASQDYIRAYTGKRTATFYVSGTTQKIKADTMTLKANQMYSLFLANVVATPDYLLTRDTISQPAAGMAAVRFVNVSPDVPLATLAIQNVAVIAQNKAYRTYSSFVPVNGNTTCTFEILRGTTATVLATLPNITLRAGSVYTVWIQGLAGGSNSTALTAHIQNNAYYY